MKTAILPKNKIRSFEIFRIFISIILSIISIKPMFSQLVVENNGYYLDTTNQATKYSNPDSIQYHYINEILNSTNINDNPAIRDELGLAQTTLRAFFVWASMNTTNDKLSMIVYRDVLQDWSIKTNLVKKNDEASEPKENTCWTYPNIKQFGPTSTELKKLISSGVILANLSGGFSTDRIWYTIHALIPVSGEKLVFAKKMFSYMYLMKLKPFIPGDEKYCQRRTKELLKFYGKNPGSFIEFYGAIGRPFMDEFKWAIEAVDRIPTNSNDKDDIVIFEENNMPESIEDLFSVFK